MNCHIVLEKFEVIFHLLCGYYFLLAIIEKFHYYFGFDTIIYNFKKEYDSVKDQDSIKNVGDYIGKKMEKFRVDFASQIGGMKPKKAERAIKAFGKEAIQTVKFKEEFDKGEDIIKMHYSPSDHKHSEFFNFYKNYYLITGFYCVTILILQGFIDEWDRFINLEILNIVDVFLFAFIIYKLFSKKTTIDLFKVSVWEVSIITVVVFVLIISLPSNFSNKLKLFTFRSFSQGDIHDFDILFSIFLAFLPILIHCCFMFITKMKCDNFRLFIKVYSSEMLKEDLDGAENKEIPTLPS